MARKALTKKTRFEVFKRDSFTCQYCGRSAPDIILNVDHMIPVASGGDNSVLNLVTSCFDCNSGKSDRKLDDKAVVTKQIDQLKILNERKTQIEMITKWRAGLVNLEEAKLDAIREAIDLHLSKAKRAVADEFLRTDIKSALARFGLDDVLQAVEKSANQYLRDYNDQSQRNKFLEKISGICYWAKHERENPEIAQVRKVAYFARKQWYWCDLPALTRRLLQLHNEDGFSTDELYSLVASSRSYSAFQANVKEMVGE